MNSNCRTSFAFQFQKHFVEMNLQKVKLTVVDRIRDGMIFKFQDSSHVQKQHTDLKRHFQSKMKKKSKMPWLQLFWVNNLLQTREQLDQDEFVA